MMRRTYWWAAGAVGLVIAAVVVAVLGVWLMTIKDRQPGTVDGPAARSAVLDVAQTNITKIFSYDYRTVERSIDDAYPLLTPDYGREFQKTANAQIIPEARKRQVVVQAAVVGTAVESLDLGSAELLVFMNRTVTEPANAPVYDGSRLQVTMRRVDNKWLIDFIKPI
jgi:Mce-associated membrane protein